MADIGVAIEGLGYASESWAGWRFILSGSYRKAVRESWKSKPSLQVTSEIFFGLLYMAFSSLFIIWVIAKATG